MELAILAVLAVLAIPVGVIVLFVQLGGVKRRLEVAEAQLKAAQARLDAVELRGASGPVAVAVETVAEPGPEGVPEAVPEEVMAAVGPWQGSRSLQQAPR